MPHSCNVGIWNVANCSTHIFSKYSNFHKFDLSSRDQVWCPLLLSTISSNNIIWAAWGWNMTTFLVHLHRPVAILISIKIVFIIKVCDPIHWGNKQALIMMLLQVSCSHRKLKSQLTSYSGNQKLQLLCPTVWILWKSTFKDLSCSVNPCSKHLWSKKGTNHCTGQQTCVQNHTLLFRAPPPPTLGRHWHHSNDKIVPGLGMKLQQMILLGAAIYQMQLYKLRVWILIHLNYIIH